MEKTVDRVSKVFPASSSHIFPICEGQKTLIFNLEVNSKEWFCVKCLS